MNHLISEWNFFPQFFYNIQPHGELDSFGQIIHIFMFKITLFQVKTLSNN